MGHIDINSVSYFLSDGRQLLNDVNLRVGDGTVTALIGPNGAGKTTLMRLISGEIDPHSGAISRSGELGVMSQFVGKAVRGESEVTVKDLLLDVAPPRIQEVARKLHKTEDVMLERDDEASQMKYAEAVVAYSEAGGYEWEVHADTCTVAAFGVPFDRSQDRNVNTLSGGEQKRLVLESLLRGPASMLLLDEPDNYLDVPTKRWLEDHIRATDKTVLLITHDRELLNRVATRIATLEPGVSGATLWVHPGNFTTYHQARKDRISKLENLRKRWDEEHVKLKELVVSYRLKAKYNSDMAARLQAAETRLAKFIEAGPPQAVPLQQKVSMRLEGGRTAKRALVVKDLELTGLMKPFSTEIWYGERVAILGSNGSGKSHFLRLLALGGTDPAPEHQPVGDFQPDPVQATGLAKCGSRVRPGWFAQTHQHEALMERSLLDILHRGDDHRKGMPRDQAARALDRYELAKSAEQTFGSLSGGQQARFQILLLELSGATMLLLDEPTDNLDLHSAEALEDGLDGFDGTVIAVTHDRWFAKGFDRYLVFGSDGVVYESDEPVWGETRVQRDR